MDLGLDQKVCVVTGATGGIGLATARLLCAEGARVLFVARDRERLAEASAACGGDFLAIDVTEHQAAELIVRTATEQLGGLHALVSNAGASFVKPSSELTDFDWQGLWELHVMATMKLMRAAAPVMAAAGGGRIVSVGSSAGKRPSGMNIAYAATKAAQHSVARAYADEYAGRNVLVNTVAPGPVSTALWTGEGGLADQNAAAQGVTREQALEGRTSKVPLGRFAEPEEIADVIALLCSERAGTVTGATWSADGGTVPVIL